MSFVSSEFVVFYVIVFVVYYAIPVLRVQNLLIVAGSYIFYGWWDWRFLPMLLGISLTNYATAIWIDRASGRRAKRMLLIAALAVSLGVLAIFKYFDFFAQSLAGAARSVG